MNSNHADQDWSYLNSDFLVIVVNYFVNFSVLRVKLCQSWLIILLKRNKKRGFMFPPIWVKNADEEYTLRCCTINSPVSSFVQMRLTLIRQSFTPIIFIFPKWLLLWTFLVSYVSWLKSSFFFLDGNEFEDINILWANDSWLLPISWWSRW